MVSGQMVWLNDLVGKVIDVFVDDYDGGPVATVDWFDGSSGMYQIEELELIG